MRLSDEIAKTVEYAKQFGCPLTREQLFTRIISSKVISHWPLVTGIKLENNKSKIYLEKMEKARKLVNKLARFDEILMIGVTGSVAAGWPKKEADIDLMVICRKNTLWLTRLRLMLWVKVNRIKLRKYWGKESGDEFCFNLWIDETGLEIPNIKQNLRSGVDLVMMTPLLNKENTYQKFLAANSWAKKWVATGYQLKIKNAKLKIENEIKEKIIINILNWVAFWGQYLYMRPKMRREIVDLHRAYFHP